MKTCTICGETKSITEFKKHQACKSGYVSRCKKCVNQLGLEKSHRDNPDKKYKEEISRTPEQKRTRKVAYQKAYYQKNKELFQAYRQKHIERDRDAFLSKKRRYYQDNKDKVLETIKLYRIEHKEEIRARRVIDKPKRRKRWVQRYGITFEQYLDMLKEQDYRCAICGDEPEGDRFLYIDHDHSTGKVRGLLCMRCNAGLGALKDSTEIILKAAEYLRKHEQSNNTTVADERIKS